MKGKSVRIPASTYRFQFNRSFTLAQAGELIDYLHDLGITDVYSSPIFPAGPDSTHGYDVSAFDQINPNLGTREEFEAVASRLRARGMGLLLDIVPNHMGTHATNCLWRDVLKHGRASQFAHFFDIEWFPPNPSLREKVLLPILGDHYGQVLARGELKLLNEHDEVQLAYFDQRFPLSPQTEEILRHATLAEVDADKAHLHRVIERQHYRLAYWRVGPYELNYRRFFDVTSLIAVRVEDPSVFERSHRFIFDLLESGAVTGLRVDHPDGLRDPKTYFDHLQRSRPVFVTAEKILSENEALSTDWEVAGTTGYDFLVTLNAVFVNPASEKAFTDIYHDFTGRSATYAQTKYESKKHVLDHLFTVEVETLAARLKQIAAQTIDGIDFGLHELRSAIVEFAAAFPVYRTYLRPDKTTLESVESQHIQKAVAEAAARQPALKAALGFLGRLLAFDSTLPSSPEFVFRLQQLTGPATAKGLEDTAFYRYTRLVSLNEVGGNPGQFGISLDEFHRHNEQKSQHWPHSQLATSTHDTKRSEDFRARLNVLSELPDQWRAALASWHGIAASLPEQISRADEYLIYQTLLGIWTSKAEQHPAACIERVQHYIIKAAREAKLETSWTDPNNDYETALKSFIASLINSSTFLAAFRPFQQRVAFFGVFNSLSQLVLKTCSPGVPDFYQGTELWDFSLVDPDNRRPVDYESRKALLEKIKSDDPAVLLHQPGSGAIKMFLTARLLRFRRENRDCFDEGGYVPIPGNAHVCAFARIGKQKEVVVVAPRLIATLLQGRERVPLGHETWAEEELPISGAFRNVLTGEELKRPRLAEIFRTLPVAVLEKIHP